MYSPNRLTQCILCILWSLLGTKVASSPQPWRPIQDLRSTYIGRRELHAGPGSVACQDFLSKSLPVHAQEHRGKLLLHVAGKSSKRLLGYCPILKPRQLTASTYIPTLREEVLWHSARRFLCDAAALSRISVRRHDILKDILEPADHSHNLSPDCSPKILTRDLARSLLGTN